MSKFNAKTYLVQLALSELGFNPGELDGDEGTKTLAAVSAFEKSPQFAAAVAALKKDVPVTATGIAGRLLTAAMSKVGVRETNGKNQGAGIAEFWPATYYPDGYKNREPYCAAFVCWAVREGVNGAAVPFSLPRSALAYDFDKWAKANAGKGVLTGIKPADAKPGDIFTLSTASHCGIIRKREGNVLFTVEANTDPGGSREGDGVYARSRSFSSIRNICRIL